MNSFAEAISRAQDHIGAEIGESRWVPITQDRVTAFGGLTFDFDPHHIDPRQAADGPFGVAVAHGFMVLSFLTHFLYEAAGELGFTQNINYGFDRVRFVAPVAVGAEIKGRFVLNAVEPKAHGALLRFDVAVCDRTETTVMAAQWLVLVLP